MFARSCLLVLAALLPSVLAAAEFPTPVNSGPHPARPPLSPVDAAAALQLPPGFQATVFAGEPDVQNPIGMAWDARGRLWIAENYTYADRTLKFDLRLRDRVLVFADANGDGRFSSRHVFVDDIQRLTSVEVGLGGVWLMCPPQLLFVPDRDEDGRADGPAEVVLDGFTIPGENYHNFANGLRFGPDGWLYGRCGAASPGELGVPGTPREDRVPMRGTMWRYHPTRRVVEALGTGTTNPWGHDWDQHGELFFINTVNGHLWHGITGAHYVRAHTLDPNARTYGLIDMHADHWHFDTAHEWQKSRDGAANAFGGGHAHGGMMIYQGDNWPAEYRNRLFTLNFHGRRMNQEILERRGSGYVGKHAPDFMVSGDAWFRGIELGSGPDGGVFVLDWSDTGECHNSTGVSRTSGRIYKIVHQPAQRSVPGDVTQMGGRALAALQLHPNEWFARQGRLQLAKRAAQGQALTHASDDLRAVFQDDANVPRKLRALWALHAMKATTPDFLRQQLRHPSEHVRAWAIRLLTDEWPLDTVLSLRPRTAPAAAPALFADLVALAKTEPAALVRLVLASTLQRLPVAQRPALAAALVRHAADAADHNLPLMIWYGLIPVAPDELPAIAGASESPVTRRLIARRLAEDIEQQPAALDALLTAANGKGLAFTADVLGGMVDGLKGWRRARKPAAWDDFVANVRPAATTELQTAVRDLQVLFGDGRALDEVKAIVLDAKADLSARKAALGSLIEARPPDLRQVCQQVMRIRFLNSVAVRGLALSDDPAVGELIAGSYTSFHPTERGAVIETLVSRRSFVRALLAGITAGRIPRADLTPFHARQIRALNEPALMRQLADAWGELRDPAADKTALIGRLKSELTPAALAAGNKRQGRAVYAASCASCHRLYGEGGGIGPDLTGAGRDNLDYLLENIADPSAVVTADFRLANISLKDGRTLNGFVAARTERSLTIRGMTETHTVERSDVERMEQTAQSMMPDGLLDTLNATQRRDLFAYLMHMAQVPLP